MYPDFPSGNQRHADERASLSVPALLRTRIVRRLYFFFIQRSVVASSSSRSDVSSFRRQLKPVSVFSVFSVCVCANYPTSVHISNPLRGLATVLFPVSTTSSVFFSTHIFLLIRASQKQLQWTPALAEQKSGLKRQVLGAVTVVTCETDHVSSLLSLNAVCVSSRRRNHPGVVFYSTQNGVAAVFFALFSRDAFDLIEWEGQ